MLANHDWVHTDWAGNPDPEGFRSKPVLSMWAMAISMRAVGLASDGGYSGEMEHDARTMVAVRLPFILFATMGLSVMWWMLARPGRPQAGVAGAARRRLVAVLLPDRAPGDPRHAADVDGDRRVRDVRAGARGRRPRDRAVRAAARRQAHARARRPPRAVRHRRRLRRDPGDLLRGLLHAVARARRARQDPEPGDLVPAVDGATARGAVARRPQGRTHRAARDRRADRDASATSRSRCAAPTRPRGARSSTTPSRPGTATPSIATSCAGWSTRSRGRWATAGARPTRSPTTRSASRRCARCARSTCCGATRSWGLAWFREGPPGLGVIGLVGVLFTSRAARPLGRALYDGAYELKRGVLLMRITVFLRLARRDAPEGRLRFIDERLLTHIVNRAAADPDHSLATFEMYTSQLGRALLLAGQGRAAGHRRSAHRRCARCTDSLAGAASASPRRAAQAIGQAVFFFFSVSVEAWASTTMTWPGRAGARHPDRVAAARHPRARGPADAAVRRARRRHRAADLPRPRVRAQALDRDVRVPLRPAVAEQRAVGHRSEHGLPRARRDRRRRDPRARAAVAARRRRVRRRRRPGDLRVGAAGVHAAGGHALGHARRGARVLRPAHGLRREARLLRRGRAVGRVARHRRSLDVRDVRPRQHADRPADDAPRPGQQDRRRAHHRRRGGGHRRGHRDRRPRRHRHAEQQRARARSTR